MQPLLRLRPSAAVSQLLRFGGNVVGYHRPGLALASYTGLSLRRFASTFGGPTNDSAAIADSPTGTIETPKDVVRGRGRRNSRKRAAGAVDAGPLLAVEDETKTKVGGQKRGEEDEEEDNVPLGSKDSQVYKTPKPAPLSSPLPADTPDHILERHRVRVDNLLAQAGFCARRDARQFCRGYWVVALKPDGKEERILTGKTKVLPWELRVEGEGIEHAGKILTLAMHKPQGYVCSHADDEGPSVYDLLPQTFLMRKPLLSSIGRLDKLSSGLLLFTQDGKLNSLLSNPGAQENGYGGCPKEYLVSLEEELSEAGVEAAAFSSGRLQLVDGTICAPALLVPHSKDKRVCKVTLGEGKHHQIRRMFAAIGHAVTGIHRVAYGGLKLPDLGLKPGEWRLLEEEEVQRAMDAVKATKRRKDGTIETGIKPTVPPLPKTALPYLPGGGGGGSPMRIRLPRVRIAKEMPKLSASFEEAKRLLAAEADKLDKEEAQAKAATRSKAKEEGVGGEVANGRSRRRAEG